MVVPSELLDPSRRIERRIYTDPDVYQLELERIFRRSWIFVGVASQLENPRDFITATIGEQPVIVARNRAGELHAFYNTCTHRAALIAMDKSGSCPAFRCMYHGWTFDHAGHLTGVPYPDAYGEDFRKSDYDIPQVQVAVFAGLVFVAIDPLVPDIAEYLGEAGAWLEHYCKNDDLELLGRTRWRYPGNWKLYHENFTDNYHPEFVHRSSTEAYRGVEVAGWNYQLDDGHSLLLFPDKSYRNDARVQEYYQRVLGREIVFGDGSAPSGPPPKGAEPPSPSHFGHGIMTIFPTLNVQSDVGPHGALPTLQVVKPEGVDSTVVEAFILVPRTFSPEQRQRRLHRPPDVGSGTFISADDNEAAIRCQIGSFAKGVPYSNMDRGQAPGKEGAKRDEYSLRSFHRGWNLYMEAGR